MLYNHEIKNNERGVNMELVDIYNNKYEKLNYTKGRKKLFEYI